MPTDPAQLNESHVMHWLRWALNTFCSASIKPADWLMSDLALCAITHDQFKGRVSVDPHDLFWTNLELLSKCKVVAMVQKAAG